MDRLVRLGSVVTYVLIAAACFWLLRQYSPVRVAGGSMNPALHAGDLVLIDRERPVHVTDIALLATPGHGPVLHRVIGVEPSGALKTKGDANQTADARSVPVSEVVGPVIVVVPFGGLLERWRPASTCDTLSAHTE